VQVIFLKIKEEREREEGIGHPPNKKFAHLILFEAPARLCPFLTIKFKTVRQLYHHAVYFIRLKK
jgi:hypothetical protein